jgi:hypothetical protein
MFLEDIKKLTLFISYDISIFYLYDILTFKVTDF